MESKTPDEIIQGILDSQVDSSIIDEAQYQCYMKNVTKILSKLGEYELVSLVNQALRKHTAKLEYNSKVEIVEPIKKYYTWLPYWKSYLKKIPKAGLNNLTRKPSWYRILNYGEWKGKPTIIKRLRKIVALGFFSRTPPFLYYAGAMMTNGTEVENLPKIRELTKEIIEKLENLYYKMDTIHVMPKEEVEHWKQKIWDTILDIRKKSGFIGLELLLEADYKDVQSLR